MSGISADITAKIQQALLSQLFNAVDFFFGQLSIKHIFNLGEIHLYV
jgi:hypothetical protein